MKDNTELDMHAIGMYCNYDGMRIASITSDGYRIKKFGPKMYFAYPYGLQKSLKNMAQIPFLYTNYDHLNHAITSYHINMLNKYLKDHYTDQNKHPIHILGYESLIFVNKDQPHQFIHIGNVSPLLQVVLEFYKKQHIKNHDITCIYNFKKTDINSGGTGSPIEGTFHQSLLRMKKKPIASLYIDDKIQVFIISEQSIQGFDIGIGTQIFHDMTPTKQKENKIQWNALIKKNVKINDFVSLKGRESFMQKKNITIDWLLNNDFYSKPPPKAYNYNSSVFHRDFTLWETFNDTEIFVLLNDFLVQSIVESQKNFFSNVKSWVVSGIGQYYPYLLQTLKNKLPQPLELMDQIPELDVGNFLKAQATAFLAIRFKKNLPTTFPLTTGAPKAFIAGEEL